VTRAISRDKSAWRLEFSGQEFSGQEGVEFGGQTEFGGQEFRNLVVRRDCHRLSGLPTMSVDP
jgi:hypothetical protein